MTKKKSNEPYQEAQAKKQRGLMIAGITGLLIVIILGFYVLQGQESGSQDISDLSESPEVGALAPNFQLVSNSGQQVSLSDFRGRPVALTFMHTW